MHHRRSLAAVLAAGFLSTAVLAGAGSPAHAAGDTATLTITKITGTSDCEITVSCHADLIQFQERNLGIQMIGDDTFDDDELFTFFDAPDTQPNGDFFVQFPLLCSALNEDWGGDEVFAEVTFFDPTTGTRQFPSNTIHRRF